MISKLYHRHQLARKQRRLIAAYKAVFNGGEDAFLVLEDIMKATKVFDVFEGNDLATLPMFEGKRSVGYYINSQINPTRDELKLLELSVREEQEIENEIEPN